MARIDLCKTPKDLRRKLKAQAAKANIGVLQVDEEDEDEDEDEDEHLTLADSLWFPVLGSISLLSIFLLLKYVGKEVINMLIGGYCE